MNDVTTPAAGVYPRDLERAVPGDLALRLRPIRPGDASALVAFHRRLSPDSIYRRYFSVHPELSAAEVAHLTEVDYVDRLAFVLVDGDRLVGVGRYDRLPGSSRAEVAFVVEDVYQHRGLGGLLLESLASAARTRGVDTFLAETQVNNREMLAVFTESGYAVTTSLEDEVVSVRVALDRSGATSSGEATT